MMTSLSHLPLRLKSRFSLKGLPPAQSSRCQGHPCHCLLREDSLSFCRQVSRKIKVDDIRGVIRFRVVI